MIQDVSVLPTGTVTMLFSDIEGSTALLTHLGPDAYSQALDIHRRVLRSAWAGHGGVEMGTEGDSFFVVFESATDGVRAAVEAQRALRGEAWPEQAPVRVRMGLHTGEPVLHDDGYVGIDVHRAARVSASAHGGQIVLTESTRALIGDVAPGGAPVTDLGSHRFKDLGGAIRIYQVTPVDNEPAFPPIKSLGTATSLPTDRTPLIGREAELADLGALLGRTETRLVTLTGPGGAGKTRLAIAAAALRATAVRDGVFFVPLAEATTAEAMWAGIIGTVSQDSAGAPPDQFTSQLADRELVLVLDNLEQIGGAGEVVHQLLDATRQTTIIATSRGPLHVLGEREFSVSPLVDATAVELFCQYAAMARPGFRPTDDTRDDIAAICARLDGLPLALELAASRTRLLSPASLLAHLDSSLDLRASATGRAERHTALRDTISWSYDLLDDDHQRVFRRLGVFAGGATFEAAAEVAMHDVAGDPYDLLSDLLEASLIVVAEDAVTGEPRVDMLQTIAEFAAEQLAGSPEVDDVRVRWARHFVAFASEQARQMARGVDQLGARRRLLDERANVRSVLNWSLRPEGPLPPPVVGSLGIEMCMGLKWMWWGVFGWTAEVARWHERALEVVPRVDSVEHASLLRCSIFGGDRALSDPLVAERLAEATAIAERLDDPLLIAEVTAVHASILLMAENIDDAAASIDRALSALSRLPRAVIDGDANVAVFATEIAADVDVERGDHESALDAYRRLRDDGVRRGDEISAVSASVRIAMCTIEVGGADAALRQIVDVVPRLLRLGHRGHMANALGALAHIHARLGNGDQTAWALGANWASYRSQGLGGVMDSEESWMQRTGVAAVRDAMPRERWDALIAEGEAMDVEEALVLTTRGATTQPSP
jgi:predicted ATPase/class 3 adenylate cyclase